MNTNAQSMGEEIADVWSATRAARILPQIKSESDARWFATISVIVERYIQETEEAA